MARTKRPPGEGTVTQRKDGRQEAAKTIGYNEHGNPIRLRAYGRTQGEARAKLEQKIQELGGPTMLATLATLADASKVTVKEWMESWLQYKETVDQLKPGTLARYRCMSNVHIIPAIGNRRLLSIRPAHVEHLLAGIAAKGLSKRMVRYVWQTLNSALKQALRRELIPSNPCAAVAPRGGESSRQRVQAWTPEQMQVFLAEAKGSSFYPLYYTALTTGLRRGELIALELGRDVEIHAGTLTVRETQALDGTVTSAKTARSQRTIKLPADTLGILRSYVGERTTGRLFLSPQGKVVDARNLLRDFARLLKACNTNSEGKAIEPPLVPRITFHGLRHTYATLALYSGMQPLELSRRLGHADTAITMRVYAHVIDELEQEEPPSLATLLASRATAEEEHKEGVN
jgi:integrase